VRAGERNNEVPAGGGLLVEDAVRDRPLLGIEDVVHVASSRTWGGGGASAPNGPGERHARPECVPVGGSLLGEPDLTRASRHELVARVSKDADPGHEDVEAVVADRHHAADDALRDPPIAGEPLDACRDLGPVG
jgi:hypothetical protein